METGSGLKTAKTGMIHVNIWCALRKKFAEADSTVCLACCYHSNVILLQVKNLSGGQPFLLSSLAIPLLKTF